MSNLNLAELGGLLLGQSRETDQELLEAVQVAELIEALQHELPAETIAFARAHVVEYLTNKCTENPIVYRKMREPDEYGTTAIDRLRASLDGSYGEESSDIGRQRREVAFGQVLERAVDLANANGVGSDPLV